MNEIRSQNVGKHEVDAGSQTWKTQNVDQQAVS
jgi:hypothetical protein